MLAPTLRTPDGRRRVPAGAVVAVILLGCLALLSPLAGIAFTLSGLTCLPESPGFVCTPWGEDLARVVPPVGAGIGLLIGIVGCLPRVRRRAAWLSAGYAVAVAGIAAGLAIAVTAP